MVIKTGLALNCQIPEKSKFDRKNYFYPDLPKGYQVSQYDMPFCENGFLEIGGRKIKIKRIHLEEDTGRLLHPSGENYSLVDFNRAGIPLMELVTEPDLRTAKEARQFGEELQLILRYLGVSDADMEKGQMRVEVNISVSKDTKLGTKVEIKNLNSFRSVEKAIDYEIKRQAEALEQNAKIIQETRGWNDARGTTVSQRKKEEAHDYRYFPEPDLPTLDITKEFVKEVRAEIPELPYQKIERLQKEYDIAEKNARMFAANRDLGEYFEKVMSELYNWVKDIERKEKIAGKNKTKLAELASNYLITDLQGLLENDSFSETGLKITPENFAEFITLIYKGGISSKIAKQVLKEMYETGADPSHIIEDKELIQIVDEKEIEKIIKKVISKNPKATEDYKKGKSNAFQYLIGQVMAATRGKASPEVVQRALQKNLSCKI